MSILSMIPGIGTAVDFVGGLGSLFGGKGEDKSSTGFNTYLGNSNRSNLSFPSTAFVVQAARNSGWPSDDIAAIQSTYDQSTGTGSKGDWRFAINSVTPLQVKFFKGASESFVRASNVSFDENAGQTNQQPNTNGAPGKGSSISTSSMPSWVKWVLIAVASAFLPLIVFKLFSKR